MNFFGIYVLSEDPPVFATMEGFIADLLPRLQPSLKPHLLIFPFWTKETFTQAAKTRWQLRRAAKLPSIWMCTTPGEVQRLSLVGYRSIWCHQNLFIDESTLTIVPREKKYDAVYTAQIRPYKRLPLAQGVKSLRLITGTLESLGDLPALGLGHAVCNREYLDRAGMAEALNECRVGLALSAVEGGMLACTEYLLCGLPVVSTPSLGGRDVWFDSGNARIVPPDADEIAKAVQHFVDQPPHAEQLRADTLRRVRFFRTAMAEIVRRITGKLPFDAEAIDGTWFPRNFVSYLFLDEYLKSYTKGHFERSDLLGRLK